MSEQPEKRRKLMEPFLLKMALRDQALIESKNESNKRGKNSTSTSRRTSLQQEKRESLQHEKRESLQQEKRNSNKQEDHKTPTQPLPKTNIPNIANRVEVEVQTKISREVMKQANPQIRPSPTIMSVISETSIKSSVSSISIRSTIRKSTFYMEDSHSFYQGLIIPFSGFTEADVKEIRGGKEPKMRQSNSKHYPSTNLNPNDIRPVLKKEQSERRKSSYDRYILENIENFISTRNNTEDSSYNTVIAVKMMVEDNTKFGEMINNVIIDEPDTNLSKDTIFFGNSEVLDANVNDQIEDASFQNYSDQNVENAPEPTHKKPSISYEELNYKLLYLKKQLDLLDSKNEKIQEQYDEAERAYFTAKLNKHRMRVKRERLILQMVQLENELSKMQ